MDDDGLNAVGGHCPVCGQEYRPGFTVCADDGAELVPGPPPVPDESDEASDQEEPASVDLGDSPTVLGSWPLQEALLIAGRLRSIGLRAVAERDNELGPYQLADAVFQSLVRVYVAAEDLEQARRVVQRIADRSADGGP